MREKFEAKSEKEVGERVFQDIISEKLAQKYVEELEELDFSEKQIAEFKRAISSLSSEKKMTALAMPVEMRWRRFVAIKKQGENGTIDMHAVVARFAEEAEKGRFSLGYHLSAKNIFPKKNPENGNTEWDVIGLEVDDRDDLGRAYYSMDYENFYRKKPTDYVYVVRAETGANSSHEVDESNRWGRASKISIIAQFSREEIDEQVKNSSKKQKTAA